MLKELIDKMIEEELAKAQKLETGSAEKVKAMEAIEKLQKIKLEEERYEREEMDRLRKQKMDDEELEHRAIKENEELKKERRDLIVRIVLTLIEIGAPLALYGAFLNKGFKFETEGTYTSTTFKNLFNKIGPKRT